MQIKFLGHSGFLITGQTKILIDPFITGNPAAVQSPDEIAADLILVTHGHSDHMGDALQISKRTGATIVSVFEVANYCSRHGASVHPMQIGGSHKFGDLKIKLTPAWHSSSISDGGPAEYLGNPCGFIIFTGDKTIYHSGDTGLFGDMGLIGKLNNIDLAMLPIGDNYTMGPEDALEAVRLLNPKLVIPMHYNTWPLIAQNPESFKADVESQTRAKVVILNPGENYDL
ncbi:metal-dependent hydrolase [Desulfolucanica intricata]|uniref:metal-dependent hydrolase n=1 Tax=Desulfolucanica intricata TaxID=1285191 RepID=UPI0008352751|nr:metal-dependent hydrolase [Desulfolucanica intricata]